MDPETWKRAKALLAEALEREAEERGRFLEEACGDDRQLREVIESLVAADEAAGGFLETRSVRETGHASVGSLERGERIGPYRILRLIGEGGMGEVYEAEQERPVRRNVALKLIKLGMDTRQVVARFDTERQALALMNHPHIAGVFDAGATDQGRPYFAMEYVQGEILSEYCDRHRLSTSERLELFLQVCDAVHHAHQKGVIHRDIKPSNVLVTILNDKPVPKIIDFGVAKAAGQPLTAGTFFTEFGQLVGTPGYMSPEQAEMTGLDIDTRSDVYSLGVLLYELLTGAQPFDWKEIRAFDVIRRKIREEEPPKPSTRLKSLQGDAPAIAAKNRRTDVPSLASQLRGDLDWITMKALEKDRTRRYSSVSDLSADIARHLAHEPVLAGPSSTVYRIRKFVRRHRLGVIAASLVIFALVAGVAGTTVGLVRARQAEGSAREEAERASQEAETARRVSEFLVELFSVSDPGEARGNEITAREILDRGAERITRELADQPLIQARLMDTIGLVYQELGLYDDAESLWLQALKTWTRVHGEEDLDVAATLNSLGSVLRRQGRHAESEAMQRRALTIRQKLLGTHDPLTADSMNSLGIILHIQGKNDEAERLLRQAVRIKEETLGEDHAETADSVNDLATFYSFLGRFEEAEPLYRRALAIGEKTLGPDHPKTGIRLQNLGTLYQQLDRKDEAEIYFERGLEVLEKVYGDDHPDVANTLSGLAEVYTSQQRYAEAEGLFRRALTILERKLGKDNPFLAYTLMGMAKLERDQGRDRAAEAHYRRALSVRENAFGTNHPAVLATLEPYASFLRSIGRDEEAAALERRIRETPEAKTP